jgi:MFS family permease
MTSPPTTDAGSGAKPVTVRTRRLAAAVLPADRVTRWLAAQTLVNTFGNGLFFTASAVFFTRSVGLSAGQVGLGLTIAGACGVAAGIPLGHLADRLGARRLLVVLSLAEAVGLVAYLRVHSFLPFVLVACVVTALDRGGSAVRGALFAVVLAPETRVRSRAYLRAVTNVGMGAGAALAAGALAADTRGWYVALIIGDAVTFLASAALLARIPLPHHTPAQPTPPTPNSPGASTAVGAAGAATAGGATTAAGAAEAAGAAVRRRWWVALADGPYLAVTALCAVQALQFGLLDVGVPLWIVQHTNAPAALVSAIMITNTVMVVLFQVRATRGTEDVRRALVLGRRAGLVLCLACLVYGVTHGLPAVGAALVLLVAGVVQTVGELLSSAVGWALSYELADQHAPGAYQGVFNSGFAAAVMLAPLLVTSTALRFGLAGWTLLAALFAASGLALVPVGHWAAARRTGQQAEQASSAVGR